MVFAVLFMVFAVLYMSNIFIVGNVLRIRNEETSTTPPPLNVLGLITNTFKPLSM